MIRQLALLLLLATPPAPKVDVQISSNDDVVVTRVAPFDLAKEKAAIQRPAEAAAKLMSAEQKKDCLAGGGTEGLCARMITTVDAIYVAAVVRPGAAAIVVMKLPDGSRLATMLMRQPSGVWGVLPEDFL